MNYLYDMYLQAKEENPEAVIIVSSKWAEEQFFLFGKDAVRATIAMGRNFTLRWESKPVFIIHKSEIDKLEGKFCTPVIFKSDEDS